jgi:hypothetical protein
MSNTIKMSFNLLYTEKDYLRSVANANNMPESVVIRSALRLLKTLGERGVQNEVNIVVPQPITEERRQGPVYILPFDLDLSAIHDQQLPSEK